MFFSKLFKTKNKPPRPIFECLNTDMHCHLLPRVDDGSKSEQESAVCLNTLKSCGFSNAFLTPHYQFPRYPNKEADIEQRFEALKKELNASTEYSGVNLLGISGEYRVDDAFCSRLKDNTYKLINGKYLLIEFSLHQGLLENHLTQILFDLQNQGYEVILAHPERYPYYSGSSPLLEQLKEMGIYFQSNILSLSGFYGAQPSRKGYEMIEKGWIEFLGTDMHNTIYARALADATHDKKLEKVLATHTFMNSQLVIN